MSVDYSKGRITLINRNLLIVFALMIGVFMMVGGASAISFSSSNADASNWITSNANITINTYNQTWLEFDGVNDVLTTSIDIRGNSHVSLIYWGYVQGMAATNKTTVQWSTGNYLNLEPNSNRIALALTNSSGGTNSITKTYTSGTVNNTWIFLAMTYDGHIMSLYSEDGKLIQSKAFYGPINYSYGNNGLGIARNRGGASDYFAGKYNNILVFNRSLTIKDIQYIYNNSVITNKYFGSTNNVILNKTELVTGTSSGAINGSGSLYFFNRTNGWIQRIDNNDPSNVYNIYSMPSGVNHRNIYIDSRGTLFTGRTGNGSLFMSMGNDTNWTIPLNFVCGVNGDFWHMTETNDSTLLLGEYSYGSGSEKCAYIHKSIDNGLTWSIVYNDSDPGNITSNLGGRHVHNIKFNQYNNCSYASIGDADSVSKLIKSCNDGNSWTMVKNTSDGRSNYIPMEFTNNYRLFGEDQGGSNPTSQIVRTSDDINFEVVLTLPTDSEGYFWSSTKDEYGNLYFSSLSYASGEKAKIYYSNDEGTTWYELYDMGIQSTDHSGITQLTDFYRNYSYFYRGYNANLFNIFDITKGLSNIKLSENSGTTAYDSSGNGNNGTISGATWQNDGVTITTPLSILANLVSANNIITNPLTWAYTYLISSSVNGASNYVLLNNTNPTESYVITSSSALNTFFHNTTSLCNGSSANINSNDGNINITLNPNQYCYVLDNFNLTENQNRANSPLWFSQSSLTEKHIASNLSEVINATVVINVDSCKLDTLTYTSDTGAYTRTYTASELTGNCTNKVLTLEISGIEPAVSSNIITVTYEYDHEELSLTCSALIDGFGSFGELLALIVIVLVFGFVLSMIYVDNTFKYTDFFVASLITIVFVVVIAIVGIIMVKALC